MIKLTVGIEGMACGMCEAHINETVRNTFQVKKVTSSHTKKHKIQQFGIWKNWNLLFFASKVWRQD